ncbi:hypothetical protein HOE04_01335 [archaeon]|nr:hypothetical protein [archaeon]
MTKEIAIVYPVAGLSSRFGGKIKQFARVGPEGETLIEYSVSQALRAGFDKIVFVVGEKTSGLFKEMFGDNYNGVPVFYVFQSYDKEKRNKPWGTAEILCCVKDVIDCPFVFCNGDDIYGENTFRELYEHLLESDECATIGYRLIDSIPENGSVHRGIFKIVDNYVEGLKETLNISKDRLNEIGLSYDSHCSMNIFGLHPEVIDLMRWEFMKFKRENSDDKDIEFLIPNELSKLVERGKIKMRVYSAEDKWFGVTNPEDEEIVRRELRNEVES